MHTADANSLAVTLFGTPTVRCHGQVVTGFRSSKAQALLYYLAVTGRPHTRPTLAGLFWGDQPEDAARTSLSKCLSNLRDLIGDAVSVDRQTIAFNRNQPYHLDTEGFLAGLGQPPTPEMLHTWQAALALYRGDFLEGFYVREAPDFEQWVLVQRAHYREAAINGLHTLAAWCEQQDDLPQAITHTRRLLALEPWREEAHRQLMMRLARSGQRTAALAQFETCRQVLAEELAVEPDAETVALREAIRTDKMTRGQNDKMISAAPHPVILSSLQPVMNNLPIPPMPLIGRDRELADLGELLCNPQCRLITITGPGGMGKTRLALAAAAEHSGKFHQGVVFVPLTAIVNPTFLADAILQALAQPRQGTESPQTQLVRYLCDRAMLLVLDNYEQLLPDVALLLELLTHTVSVKLLVTSRERLALQAEHLFPLQGLTYPTPDAKAAISEFAAFQLFLQRARQLKPSYAPDSETCTAIMRICQVSEGLPLAIELAAGALRTQSATTIALAFDANQPLSPTRLRDRPTRHSSIQAAFEHSWQLLTTQEQVALARLAVFHAGFGLDAAEKVADADDETISALIDKSLVRSQGNGRFDLHELLRQFSAEKLSERGEKAETQWRHLHYFLQLAKEQAKQYSLLRQPFADSFIAEQDNFRAALRYGLSSAHIERFVLPLDPNALLTTPCFMAAELVLSLEDLWLFKQQWTEGLSWVNQTLTILKSSRNADNTAVITVQSKLLASAGIFSFALSDYRQTIVFMQEGVATLRTLGDTRNIIRALQDLGGALTEQGDYTQAHPLIAESLSLARQLQDQRVIGLSLCKLAFLEVSRGNHHRAAVAAQESLQLFRQADDHNCMISALNLLGQIETAQGNLPNAVNRFEEAASIHRSRNPNSLGGPWTLGNLALAIYLQGDYSRATMYYQKSLTLRYEQQHFGGMAWCIEGLAQIAAAAGDALRAIHLWGAAEALRARSGITLTRSEQTRHEAALTLVREHIESALFAAEWTRGQTMPLDVAVSEALNQ